MEVMLAKSAGFCPGVKRAVDMVYTLTTEQHRKGEPVYTYGPIIHNDEVVRDLESKGAKVIHSPEELDGLPERDGRHPFPWGCPRGVRSDRGQRVSDC